MGWGEKEYCIASATSFFGISSLLLADESVQNAVVSLVGVSVA